MLVGHTKQKKYFKNVIKNDVLSHAYLFTGQDMTGKKMLALELFESVNNRSCMGDPDFALVGPNLSEGESKIYIEDVRKLKSFFKLKPYFGPYKISIIDDAHCLTNEASNGLLKILEEPPGFSIIILITSMPGLIPATIVSRCEKIMFTTAKKEEVDDYLADKKLNKEDKDFLVKLAGGRIGLISSLMEGDGIPEARKSIDNLRKLLNSGIYERMNYVKKVHDKTLQRGLPQSGYQVQVDYWLNWVSAHVSTSPKNEKILKELLDLHQIVSQPQYNHRLALENFLLNL